MKIGNVKSFAAGLVALCALIFIAVSSQAYGQETVNNSIASVKREKAAGSKSSKNNPTQKEKTLYERLGGYDAISAVVDNFADRLFKDTRINAFFKGMSTDTRNQFKQKNKNLVCNVTGGPCKVISRTAKEAHAGWGITEKDFGIVVQHLTDVLDEFKVPEREKKELLDIIGTLKPDIAEKK